MRVSSTIDSFINLTWGRQREAMKEKNTEKKTQNKIEISLKNILVDKKWKGFSLLMMDLKSTILGRKTKLHNNI